MELRQQAVVIVQGRLRHRGVSHVAVGQHEGVLPLLVPEEVEDPLLLHQPRDEVEIGLAVLDAVGPLGVRTARVRNVEVRNPRSPKICVMMSGTFLDWKMRQSAVRVRNHSQGTTSARYFRNPRTRVREPPAKRLTKPLKSAETAVVPPHRKRDAGAHDLLGGDRILLREHLQTEMEQPRHLLPAGERNHRQHVLAERRVHGKRAILLRDCSHRPLHTARIHRLRRIDPLRQKTGPESRQQAC